MNKELKPCPFCGCEDIYFKTRLDGDHYKGTIGIECNDCEARIQNNTTFLLKKYDLDIDTETRSKIEEELIEKWNRRI